jgi:formamidopyrimidine-DNA glycosylase
MPELPEVQTVVDTLRPALCGQRIGAAVLHRADVLTPGGLDLPAHLAGRTVVDIARRAKRIVFTLDDGNRFYVHLGMTGRLTLTEPTATLEPHTHLLINFARIQLRFRDPRRFGGIWWLGKERHDAKLGPEPLTTRPQQLARRLGNTRRAIKNALLDQSLLAGLGNIYVDESLFRAGVHPLTLAADLSDAQVARLNRAIKFTLRKAIRHRGSTLRDYFDANGDPGRFKAMHTVYDRAGEPCRVCRTEIERIVVGGRSTHFCPRCQKR